MSRTGEQRPARDRSDGERDPRRDHRTPDRREGSGSPWPDEPVLHDA
jgi:hypothetical protein